MLFDSTLVDVGNLPLSIAAEPHISFAILSVSDAAVAELKLFSPRITYHSCFIDFAELHLEFTVPRQSDLTRLLNNVLASKSPI